MKDIHLLFCIISLFTGVSSISISYFIYNSNKKKSLKFFIVLNFSFFAVQNSITLGLYSKYVIQVSSFIPCLSKFLDIVGTSFSSLSGLFLINYLFGIEITNFKKTLFISIFVFQFVGITIYYLFSAYYIFKFVVRASIIAVIVYELFIGLTTYKQVVNKDLRQAIKSFILLTIVFLPLIIFESYSSYIHFIKNMDILKIAALPSYFLAINIFNLKLVLKYFNAPAFIANNKLTDYFKQKYDITEKQGEIIELIMEGVTYKQIAEKLFISPKTVDNHIQNIYKKLNVNSKMQLSNFIRSNEK
ncbi:MULTISPECIES: helix-turn-helix domain-containing protein [Clostridium]|uniref:Predicted membrane-associated response regulator with a HTH motif n=2 Tax=Clostridium TaxID=1485 RepID=D8GUE6_CLOLD|nr:MULTISPECIES: LuxR C-terminal-related transcriptional regulator [Clostridium]ADK14809.1 predicted membrane-associated response regulator with a HTH motif [Clostridium ljungdahlii DSM 13528]AGY78060.1 LuxR C-terminal-related transcriptional regulator [Clostridium autoethanogenum DSM 10061]ALU38194.1 Transcriptional regulator LuxR family [Clostridium autoethanogenum DSM 10061]OAA86010.1 Spore germination protein GerE [Clostridium ljungdahlii DSM 13528]OVY50958.1 Spore germination protein GerE